MKLLDERTQVREVSGSWYRQYGEGTYPTDNRGRMVGKELAALDPETATAEQIAEIIGNDFWVSPSKCHECGSEGWYVVQIGEEPNYESRTANICADCLRKALALIQSHGVTK
jgi:hypothetical protein